MVNASIDQQQQQQQQHPAFRRVWEEFISAAAGIPIGSSPRNAATTIVESRTVPRVRPDLLLANATLLDQNNMSSGGLLGNPQRSDISRQSPPTSSSLIPGLGGSWRPGGIGCLIARRSQQATTHEQQQRFRSQIEDFNATIDIQGIDYGDSIGELSNIGAEESFMDYDDDNPHLIRYRRIRNPRRLTGSNYNNNNNNNNNNNRTTIYRRPMLNGAGNGSATRSLIEDSANVPTFHFSTISGMNGDIRRQRHYSSVSPLAQPRSATVSSFSQLNQLPAGDSRLQSPATLASVVSTSNQVAMNAIERLERIQQRIFEIHQRHAGLTGQRLLPTDEEPQSLNGPGIGDLNRPLMLRQTIRLFRNRLANLQDRSAVSTINMQGAALAGSPSLLPPPPTHPPPPLPGAVSNSLVSDESNDEHSMDDDDDNDEPILQNADAAARRRLRQEEYQPLLSLSNQTPRRPAVDGRESGGGVQWFTSTVIPPNALNRRELPSSSFFIRPARSSHALADGPPRVIMPSTYGSPPEYHLLHGNDISANVLSRSIARQARLSESTLSSSRSDARNLEEDCPPH